MELKEIELKMSEMSDLLGVSAQGIRLYEKNGALQSFKNENNGYRYYYFEDIAPAVQMRSMRKMGVPMADCVSDRSGQKLSEMKGSLAACQRQLEANIRYETALLTVISRTAAAAEWALTHLYEFGECTRPAMYHLLCEKDGKVLPDRAGRELIRNWSEHFPFVHYCPIVPAEGLGAQTVSQIGFGLFEVDEEFAPDLESARVRYLPEETCIGGVISASRATRDYFSVIEPGLQYMEETGYELAGDMYTLLLAAGIQTDGDVCDYYYVWYPCKKRA